MICRLTVADRDRPRQFDLPPGEHIVGSAADCAVRIGSPVISRHHARLSVGEDSAAVEDLRSTNGTRVDGARLGSGARVLTLPADLAFGTIDARLEVLAADEAEAGILFQGSNLVAEDAETAGSTAGLRGPYQFVAAELPGLLARLVSGEGPDSLAPALGAALFEGLPCVDLEIRGPGDFILFTASRPEVGAVEVSVERNGLRAGFLNRAHARAWTPLLDIADRMLTLARRDSGEALDPLPRPEVPPMPAPESVVPAVRNLYQQAGRLAASNVGMLISGESGTGKEVLAGFVHRASDRNAQPFVALNCAALPGDLLEAELFGVEKGAATGVSARPGRFESAHGGTLFLDEIGDMRADTQAKILRAIEEKQVYRLGAVEAREADVRVLAATNRDIDSLLEDGRFRRDLYHRIADWRAELPPLRQRRADIPNLAAFFLHRESQARGAAIAGISRAAIDVLENYAWPGNIRELEREMARLALLVADGQLVERQHLRPEIADAQERAPAGSLRGQLEAAECKAIREALASSAGSVPEAAVLLDVGRSTLYRRIKELGIEVG